MSKKSKKEAMINAIAAKIRNKQELSFQERNIMKMEGKKYKWPEAIVKPIEPSKTKTK